MYFVQVWKYFIFWANALLFQHSLERVKNLSVSITPESRQLLAARATQEAGGESLER